MSHVKFAYYTDVLDPIGFDILDFLPWEEKAVNNLRLLIGFISSCQWGNKQHRQPCTDNKHPHRRVQKFYTQMYLDITNVSFHLYLSMIIKKKSQDLPGSRQAGHFDLTKLKKYS